MHDNDDKTITAEEQGREQHNMGYWQGRLACLPDGTLGEMCSEISRIFEKALIDGLSGGQYAMPEDDSKTLSQWRENHPDKKRKAKSIRRTQEYQDLLRQAINERLGLEADATTEIDTALSELRGIHDMDSLMAFAERRELIPDVANDESLGDVLGTVVSELRDDIMTEDVVGGIVRRLQGIVTKTLTTGDLSEHYCERGYDRLHGWHNSYAYYEIEDIDDLMGALTESSDGSMLIVSHILEGDGEYFEDTEYVRDMIDEAVWASDIGAPLLELSEKLIGGWCPADRYFDFQTEYESKVLDDAISKFDYETTLALVRKNPRYTDMFAELERREAREQAMVESMVRLMPENPIDLYPLARSMERHFVLHVGPTNSGKTHDAIDALGRAESGAYLAPLRLLAYEQYERLNDNGCPCSLLTGEEEVSVAGAHHVASTVEMLDYSSPIEVAVIDEAQMMDDRDRGSHWTEAILGVPAKEVHVCLAPEAEGIVKQVVEACGDTWKVIRHERMTPLEQEKGSFVFPKDVRKGDAVIVFTRRAVHAVAAMLASAGHRTSMIYGALPYDVRHREAERFASGETDVVVATDAIGMGMNLPIKRVVFLEQAKFDGRDKRFLTGMEIRQIAGRAGRYGIHESGTWISANENKKMGKRMSSSSAQVATAPIGFVRTLLGVDGTVSELMGKWSMLETISPFSKMDLEREIDLAIDLEGQLTDDDARDIVMKRLVYRFATMPFKENIEWLHQEWLRMFGCEISGFPFPVEIPTGNLPSSMDALETQYAHMDLLHQYCRTFGYAEHYDAIDERRRLISDRISEMIAKSVFESKRCRACGCLLPWNWPYPMCDPCHERMYPRRRWYDEW